MTELTDLSDTDANNVLVSGEGITGNTNMSRTENVFQAVLGMLSRFRNANVFKLRDNTDKTKQLAFGLSGITTATTRTLTAPDKNGTIATTADVTAASETAVRRGYAFGLGLSANPADATNDIDIAAGEVASDANPPVLLTLATALTKRIDASWTVGTNQGGLDTGSVANSPYYIWVIRRPDTGVVEVLFSLSNSAPTMPTNYTQKQVIGEFTRTAGVNGAPRWYGPRYAASSFFVSPVLQVVYQVAATVGVVGQAVTTSWVARQFNTVKENGISGASLASNQITLLAGSYEAFGYATGRDCTYHKVRLRDVTNNVTLGMGVTTLANSSAIGTPSQVQCRFTLTGTTVIEMQHIGTTAGTALSGTNNDVEINADLTIRKVGL